ncbi:MAG: Dinitrogenase iron-molybdenum cofactor biosynthesis [Desulfobulbaceae bacterium]|nr:MAG: Dinitrogenase iron-molybdenum cofactor biosynthesis [Desulfobulbaceae bacterium]
MASRANNRIRFAATGESLQAMSPVEALAWLAETVDKGAALDGVTLAGPGDPLADLGPTLEVLSLIRAKYPEMELGITTLGLGAEQAAEALLKAGVSRVTLLVDGIDLDVIRKLYAWIRPGYRTVPLPAATEMLLSEQVMAMKAFVGNGCSVGIRTTIYPGYNDAHAEDIARIMGSLGAEFMAVASYVPVEGEEALLERPTPEMMATIHAQVSKHLRLIVVPETITAHAQNCSECGCQSPATFQPKPSTGRPNVAVVSSGGMEVDLHLGHAAKALIYGPREDGLTCLLETRSLPEPGFGSARWELLADILKDCFVLLAASAGESPKKILADRGIRVLITDDDIAGIVDVLYGGGKKGSQCRKGKAA